MIGAIISFLGSGVFGSILGLFGNYMNQRMIRKNKEIDNAHEINLANQRLLELEARTRAQIDINKAQIEGTIDLQEAKTYETTIVVGNERYFGDKWMEKLFEQKSWIRIISVPAGVLLMTMFAIIDILKGFIRPLLTIAFTAGYGWVAYESYDFIKSHGSETMTIEQALVYWTLCVDACIMLAFMAGAWWFGDRRMAKAGAEMVENKRKKEEEKANTTVVRDDDIDVTIS